VRERLFNPIAVEPNLVQNGRACASKIMDREVCKLESLSVGALRNLLGDSVQRAGGNVNVSIIAYLEAPAISLSAVNISSACRDKIDIVRLARLHALLGDRPHALVKIDLLPGRFGQLALAHQREEESASRQADNGCVRRHLVDHGERDSDLPASARAPAA